MKLHEVLDVCQSTLVEVVDAETGEVLMEKNEADTIIALFEDTFKYNGEWYDAEVMDMNVWNNTLTICIEVEHDDEEDWDWDEDLEEDLFNDPDTVDGWIQQDVIDSHRRER